MSTLSANETSIPGIVVITSWTILVLPSALPSFASSTTVSNVSSTVASSTSTTSHASSITSTSTAPGLIVNPISSTTESVLCFNNDLGKDVPCSASATTAPATSGVAGYNPAGATTMSFGSRVKVTSEVWTRLFLGLVLLQVTWW
ncbi:hypothetical protein MMC27_008239 [Xylographa pallens]|nr:hypothetical protein [Xylographa pallens]